jgi:N6-L-threonylcarbamoyladenine synthase
MNVLGIETSCDESAAAVVSTTDDPARPWTIRSSVIASQVAIHREWGGVVPELASRQHVRDICGVVEQALADAGAGWDDLHAIAVTQGPGLIGSLLVGVAFAKAAAYARGLPIVGVNHLAGHIESLFLHNGPLPLPAVVLVVSGGHTSLYEVSQPGVYNLLGRTRDDAAGEAYDKVAKLLGLGYPGGPIIDRLAKEGNDRAIRFPVARMTHRDRNRPLTPPETSGAAAGLSHGIVKQMLAGRTEFSFSGIKTSVLRHVRQRLESTPVLPEHEIADICASFQRAVVDALLDRTFEVAELIGARSIGIAGGVSANSRLRTDAMQRGDRAGLPVYLPTTALSTDNAAMIAAAGLRRLERGVTAPMDLNAEASLPL